ncbi:MAG TPA: lysylphosphatidylglycerol synthase transmembrane domain-containing protein [Gemmatimonadaceae bacterium]|nr:lysylphosphatidylglycerol synthase transmembrane domain-containing protein [Gemmatimonadaceae bacterium]
MSSKRWLVVLLSFAAAMGVSLYVVFTSWPHQHAPAALPLLAHAVLLGVALLELSARAWKLKLSAHALRVPLGFNSAVRASVGGDFAAAITPARSGAEPARFLILSEAGMPRADVLLVVFAELFLEMLSLALVATVLSIIFKGSGVVLGGIIGLVGGYATFVIGIGAIGVILSRRNTSGPPPRWARRLRLNAARWRAIQRALRQLKAGIAGLKHVRIQFAVLALLSSTLHILLRLSILPIIVLAYSIYAYGIAKLTVPLAPLVLWPLALFYGGVVAPVPAGGGFIEVAFKATLGGSIPGQFLSGSLIWWRFYTFYLFLILGAIAAGNTVMRAVRGGDDEREAPDELLEPAVGGAAATVPTPKARGQR